MDTVNIPPIIPCMHGKELSINSELVGSCLSAISIKIQHKNQINTQDDLQLTNKFERRNSFFNLHRPEITSLNFAPTSPHEVEQFFHEHAAHHCSFCASLHTGYNPEEPRGTDQMKCLYQATNDIYDQDQLFIPQLGGSTESRFRANKMISLTDEDLEPGEVCHRSIAHFCLLIPNLNSDNQPKLDDISHRTTVADSKLETPKNKIEGSPSLSSSEFISQIDEASGKSIDYELSSLLSAVSVQRDNSSEVLQADGVSGDTSDSLETNNTSRTVLADNVSKASQAVSRFTSELQESGARSITDDPQLLRYVESTTSFVSATPAPSESLLINFESKAPDILNQ